MQRYKNKAQVHVTGDTKNKEKELIIPWTNGEEYEFEKVNKCKNLHKIKMPPQK